MEVPSTCSPTNHRRSHHLPFQSVNSVSSFFNVSISSVFEHFTERAIKAVIFSQREAKLLGRDMVFTRHLLLGLIAEDRHPRGFLESGITIDKAREAVHTIWHSEEGGTDDLVAEEAVSVSILTSKSTTDVPFSISTKRAFEALLLFKIECITIQLLVAKKRFKSFHKISFITIRQETSKASIQSNTSPATKPLLERLDKIDSYYSVTSEMPMNTRRQSMPNT